MKSRIIVILVLIMSAFQAMAMSVSGSEKHLVRTAKNDTIDISGQNSSSAYKEWTEAISIASTRSITFLTARYTYLNMKVTGLGTMNILSGGERTYIGGSDKMYPDGTAFKGTTHVYPYTALSTSNGFYGLVWMHGGKTFSLDAVLTNVDDCNAMNYFQNSTLVLHKGATLAAESGTRSMRIGHLEMEEGSQLYGYMKSKSGNDTYYIVGHNGQDATLAGQMSPMSESMLLGLIKEGEGTYRITGKSNNLTGGLRVLQGSALVNGVTQGPLYIMQDGMAGGVGTLKGEAQVYGTLQPGDGGVGTFSQVGQLVLRPSGRIDCEICNAAEYDQVKVNGAVSLNKQCQDFTTSDRKPRLRIYLTDDAQLQVGDTFTLLSASSRGEASGAWEFDIRYPNAYTWEVTQETDEQGFRVVARVISDRYSGQGNAGYEDVEDDPSSGEDYGTFNVTTERAINTTLRSYADAEGVYIGTAVPVWSIDVDNDADARTSLITKEFNMVVCENEMKFDAIEPNQGEFSYYHGDRLVKMARRAGQYVRGHTLAWHNQVPGWLTEDGKKNTFNRSREDLLAILKNHILNVVGHYRGQVHEWDVANEVLSDNQTTIYSNPNGYDLRPSVWATGIGEDFLDSAFVWAHQADPDARLILNDYGVEGRGWGKTEALFNLATRLRNSGIPIDGVGLQCHMDADLNYYAAIDKNIARFAEAGFLCHLTEMDLGVDNTTTAALRQQGEAYYRLTSIAMKYPACASLLIWGLTDDLSWRTGKNPLLFDAQNNKKNAYYGVHAALREYHEAVPVESVSVDVATDDLRIYDLSGRVVTCPQPNHIYLRQGRKFVYRVP